MKKEVLFRDELGRGFATAMKAGPLLFLSACEGHRDPQTLRLVPTTAGDGEAQSRNAYGRLQRVLEQCGASMGSIARRDHFISGYEWFDRVQRVRDAFFGAPAPLVSTGVAAKMPGINMISCTVVAAAPEEAKHVLVGPLADSIYNIMRVVRVGPFLFVSGVRGLRDPVTGEAAPEETPEAFGVQMRNCLAWVKKHLEECGAGLDRVVRFDTYLRDVNRGNEYRAIRQEVYGGEVPVASTGVGVLLGGRGEVEVTAVAVVPGVPKEVLWGRARPSYASAVQGGGFIFCSGTVGIHDPQTRTILHALAGDKATQVRNTLDRISDTLGACGATLSDIVRLDIFLRDVYFADDLLLIVRERFAGEVPTLTIVGAELYQFAEIEISAIAMQPQA